MGAISWAVRQFNPIETKDCVSTTNHTKIGGLGEILQD
jgi:hypothetical protein